MDRAARMKAELLHAAELATLSQALAFEATLAILKARRLVAQARAIRRHLWRPPCARRR